MSTTTTTPPITMASLEADEAALKASAEFFGLDWEEIEATPDFDILIEDL